ncbi:MAG: RdgB/HAM1 family non-canonical purine NTP pyrophosphatase [Candidatus Micrarchaeia archaeon]
MEFLFVSRNTNKMREARAILRRFGISLHAAKERKIEIQDESLENIVRYALSQIKPTPGKCFIIEDDGIFISALNGFPGPYSAQVYSSIGLGGVLKLMENKVDRSASFKSAVGVLMPDGSSRVFTGVSKGSISEGIAKGRAFGYDPIFVPEGSRKTFAEMSIAKKSKYSHRGKAFSKLGEFLKGTVLKCKRHPE